MPSVHTPFMLDWEHVQGHYVTLETVSDRRFVDVVLLLLPPRDIADLQAVAAPTALCSQRFLIAAHMACEITQCLAAHVATAAAVPATSGVAD